MADDERMNAPTEGGQWYTAVGRAVRNLSDRIRNVETGVDAAQAAADAAASAVSSAQSTAAGAASSAGTASSAAGAAQAAATAAQSAAAAAAAAVAGMASVGMADVPSISAGQTKAVAVTIRPAQPDTDFGTLAVLAGNASLLGTLSVESWTVTSKSTVTVNVKNGGLVTLAAGKILVVAAHN